MLYINCKGIYVPGQVLYLYTSIIKPKSDLLMVNSVHESIVSSHQFKEVMRWQKAGSAMLCPVMLEGAGLWAQPEQPLCSRLALGLWKDTHPLQNLPPSSKREGYAAGCPNNLCYLHP